MRDGASIQDSSSIATNIHLRRQDASILPIEIIVPSLFHLLMTRNRLTSTLPRKCLIDQESWSHK
jgi:hypothetical protein